MIRKHKSTNSNVHFCGCVFSQIYFCCKISCRKKRLLTSMVHALRHAVHCILTSFRLLATRRPANRFGFCAYTVAVTEPTARHLSKHQLQRCVNKLADAQQRQWQMFLDAAEEREKREKAEDERRQREQREHELRMTALIVQHVTGSRSHVTASRSRDKARDLSAE